MSAPDTAADPLAFTPSPTELAWAGEQTGLVAVDNGNVAIDVVRGFFQAAATGTDDEMRAFLSDPLTMSFQGRRGTVQRRRVIRQFRGVRRLLDLDTLVDTNALQFVPVDPALALEANDQAVRVPVASEGREVLGHVLGWTNASGVVYVRPHLRQIVGFAP